MPFSVDVQRISSGVLALVMAELQLHVTLDAKVENGPDVFVYENDLAQFYDDLISGRPYPLTLGVRDVKGPETLLAITLFLHRDLALASCVPGLVASLTLVSRHPIWGLSHVDREMARFLVLLQAYSCMMPNHVASAIGVLRQYILEGTYPQLPPAPLPPRVIDVGTTGFVLAKTEGDLVQGWVELYRQGHLRGLLVGHEDDSYRQVLISRKSAHVPLNLELAAEAFNDMERALGEKPDWQVEGDFLGRPGEGTGILVQHLMEVLTRC